MWGAAAMVGALGAMEVREYPGEGDAVMLGDPVAMGIPGRKGGSMSCSPDPITHSKAPRLLAGLFVTDAVSRMPQLGGQD